MLFNHTSTSLGQKGSGHRSEYKFGCACQPAVVGAVLKMENNDFDGNKTSGMAVIFFSLAMLAWLVSHTRSYTTTTGYPSSRVILSKSLSWLYGEEISSALSIVFCFMFVVIWLDPILLVGSKCHDSCLITIDHRQWPGVKSCYHFTNYHYPQNILNGRLDSTTSQNFMVRV